MSTRTEGCSATRMSLPRSTCASGILRRWAWGPISSSASSAEARPCGAPETGAKKIAPCSGGRLRQKCDLGKARTRGGRDAAASSSCPNPKSWEDINETSTCAHGALRGDSSGRNGRLRAVGHARQGGRRLHLRGGRPRESRYEEFPFGRRPPDLCR